MAGVGYFSCKNKYIAASLTAANSQLAKIAGSIPSVEWKYQGRVQIEYIHTRSASLVKMRDLKLSKTHIGYLIVKFQSPIFNVCDKIKSFLFDLFDFNQVINIFHLCRFIAFIHAILYLCTAE